MGRSVRFRASHCSVARRVPSEICRMLPEPHKFRCGSSRRKDLHHAQGQKASSRNSGEGHDASSQHLDTQISFAPDKDGARHLTDLLRVAGLQRGGILGGGR